MVAAWFYTRPLYKYYADYVDKWGVPEGIIELDPMTVEHRTASYRFEYRRNPFWRRTTDTLNWRLSKVEYVNSNTKVCIICPIHGETYQIPSNHLRSCGCQKCYHDKHKKLVCGVGVNDISYCPKPIYQKWVSMIKRCYSPKSLNTHKTYQDCSVSDEWLVLSNFKSWCERYYIEGYDLDKDLLVKGNKVYSPETCCFLPKVFNIIIRDLNNGKYRKGVSIFRHNKYISSICINRNKIHLGCFNTEQEASLAYKTAKGNYIKELAEKYFQEGKITERVYNALMKYVEEITD